MLYFYSFVFIMRRAGGRRPSRGSAYGNDPSRYIDVVEPRPTDLPTVRLPPLMHRASHASDSHLSTYL